MKKVTAAQFTTENKNRGIETTLDNGRVVVLHKSEEKEYTILCKVTRTVIGRTTKIKELNSLLNELGKEEWKASKAPSDYVPISDTVHDGYKFSSPTNGECVSDVQVNELQKRKLDAMLHYVMEKGATITNFEIDPLIEDGKGELLVTFETDETTDAFGDTNSYLWKIGRLGGWLTKDGMGRWQEGKENWNRSLADWHGGVFCRECNKVLTDPTSVAIGIGPECCTKFGISWEKASTFVAKEDKEGLEEYLGQYR